MLERAAVLAVVVLGLAGCGGSRTPSPAPQPTPGTAAPARPPAGPVARVHRPVSSAPYRRAVPLLMYHVISTPPPGAKLPGLWVSAVSFRAQVDALQHAGFTAVTLDRTLDAWRGKARLPAHPIVLTFDDGYLSQGTSAAAALRAHHWPGVLNLALHNLGVAGGLSRSRIRTLIAQGWEIDAHTIDHLDVTTLSGAALRHEIAGSRAAIRRAFGVRADAFCYPAGRFDAAAEAAVRAAGYRAATTELPGAARPGSDPYALPRIRVDGGESAAAVVASVRAALGSGG
jgi:peptidoglycan/xylan/chitin deacetylase (PgdA/CDA1 family)